MVLRNELDVQNEWEETTHTHTHTHTQTTEIIEPYVTSMIGSQIKVLRAIGNSLFKRLHIIASEPEVRTEDYPMDSSYFKFELTMLYSRNSPRSQLKAFPWKEQFEIPLT